MKIASFNTDDRPLLIAEIGNNHEGDPYLAREMADAAVEAGADVVKVQIIDPIRLVNRSQTDRIAQLQRYKLPLDLFVEIGERVRARGRLFMASAFDVDSLNAIAPHLDAVKIASGDLNFSKLLKHAALSGKPVILSTGMSSLDEIREAVSVLEKALPSDRTTLDSVAVLHCVSLYPTPLRLANLRAIYTLQSELGLTVGYSDHTLGTEAAVAAVSLGAKIIEKHFTLDKTRNTFRDHALSADPHDMRKLAEVIKEFSAMLGEGTRGLNMPDIETRTAARRSLVAARDLSAGVILTESDIDCLRPGTGMSPTFETSIIGRRLLRPVSLHDHFRETDFE